MDLFGKGILSDDAISAILSSFVSPLKSDWLLPEEEEPSSKRVHVDALPVDSSQASASSVSASSVEASQTSTSQTSTSQTDTPQSITSQASILIQRLARLERVLKGDTSTPQPTLTSGLRTDALRSALVSAGSRLQTLMREIADLRAQVRQLQRDNAKLQVAPTPSSENPVEAPLEPSTSVKEASAKKEPNAKKETSEEAEGSEDLLKQIKALQLQVESRGEAVELAERERARLERETSELRAEVDRRGRELDEQEWRLRREEENYHRCVDDLKYDWGRDEERYRALREDTEALLASVEARLERKEREWREEKERCQDEMAKVKEEAAQVRRERDAFEKKLKRRKLFGEALAATEHIIDKLRNVQKMGEKVEGEESARIEILKNQLKDMSEAFRSCEGVLHKTKNLVIFGDKKNDQLLSEFLELQKAFDELKLAKEREAQTLQEKEGEMEKLRGENEELRQSNEALERECATVMEEVRSIHSEVVGMIAGEDRYEQQAAAAEKAKAKLEKEVEELGGVVQGLRTSVKRERFRFVGAGGGGEV